MHIYITVEGEKVLVRDVLEFLELMKAYPEDEKQFIEILHGNFEFFLKDFLKLREAQRFPEQMKVLIESLLNSKQDQVFILILAITKQLPPMVETIFNHPHGYQRLAIFHKVDGLFASTVQAVANEYPAYTMVFICNLLHQKNFLMFKSCFPTIEDVIATVQLLPNPFNKSLIKLLLDFSSKEIKTLPYLHSSHDLILLAKSLPKYEKEFIQLLLRDLDTFQYFTRTHEDYQNLILQFQIYQYSIGFIQMLSERKAINLHFCTSALKTQTVNFLKSNHLSQSDTHLLLNFVSNELNATADENYKAILKGIRGCINVYTKMSSNELRFFNKKRQPDYEEQIFELEHMAGNLHVPSKIQKR